MKFPNCKALTRQVKNGFNGSGSQKYLCKECGHKYTPEPKVNGYPAETRQLAVRMHVEGNSYGSVSNMFADYFKEFF
jgi:transposase-like protein